MARVTIVKCDGCGVEIGDVKDVGESPIATGSVVDGVEVAVKFQPNTDHCPTCKTVAVTRALTALAANHGVRLGGRPRGTLSRILG